MERTTASEYPFTIVAEGLLHEQLKVSYTSSLRPHIRQGRTTASEYLFNAKHIPRNAPKKACLLLRRHALKASYTSSLRPHTSSFRPHILGMLSRKLAHEHTKAVSSLYETKTAQLPHAPVA